MDTREVAPEPAASSSNFIRTLVEADNAAGTYGGVVRTRFPPEPNGYLHIGHAKSICLNFGLARDFGGSCNLRMDDTNPSTEDVEYVAAIQRDLAWLGFQPAGEVLYASDYYEQLYAFAVELVNKGLAYVCPLSEEEIRVWRGTVNEPGRESPGRANSVEQNLALLAQMRAGAFPDGHCTLRARIDMGAANMKLRDPLLYRIRHAHHYRTGDAWCLYPMYDFAHPLSDAIEGITHSICTLEFENNRDIYDWLIANCSVPSRPKQIEFARLSLTYTVMSKRKLLELVQSGLMSGWDDPRMPTLAGLRRRGVPAEALRDFADRIGVAKANSTVEIELFENCLRDQLNTSAPRVLAVLRPLRVILEGWAPERVEWLDAPYWPHDIPKEGSRKLPFTRELFIERDDFSLDPPKGFHRLAPGREVRLRHGYIIRCERVEQDAAGEVVALYCSVDLDTKSGGGGRSVKGTIQWVSASHGLTAEVRLYDRLFAVKNPGVGTEGADWKSELNPDSLVVVSDARVEPSVAEEPPGTRYQFERAGYFWRDPVHGAGDALVFNRIVPLRDSWAKTQRAPEPAAPSKARPAPEPAAAVAAPKKAAEARPLTEAQRQASDALQARGLSADDARLLVLDEPLAQFFEEAVGIAEDPKAVASWLLNALLGEARGRAIGELPLSGAALGRLVRLVRDGAITTPAGREVLAELVANGGDPEQIVASRGLGRVSDPSSIRPVVASVVAANADKVAALRAGKVQLMGFFVGQVMKLTGGKADPQVVGELVREAVAEG